MQRTAVLSRCKVYRYVLAREWQSHLPGVLFVALNPSTADAVRDDATVRRCIGFATSWGFGRLAIANLFAFRSTDPDQLSDATDPIGPKNDWWLERLSAEFSLTVAAWGTHGSLFQRAAEVLPKLINVHHLGLTRQGHPRHPLYLPRTVKPVRF